MEVGGKSRNSTSSCKSIHFKLPRSNSKNSASRGGTSSGRSKRTATSRSLPRTNPKPIQEILSENHQDQRASGPFERRNHRDRRVLRPCVPGGHQSDRGRPGHHHP